VSEVVQKTAAKPQLEEMLLLIVPPLKKYQPTRKYRILSVAQIIHCGVHLGSCGECNTHAGRDGICHIASASSTVSASESFAIRPPPSLQPYTGGASRLLYLENMASVSRRQAEDERSAARRGRWGLSQWGPPGPCWFEVRPLTSPRIMHGERTATGERRRQRARGRDDISTEAERAHLVRVRVRIRVRVRVYP
jgi:hypothetical protein